MSINKSSSTHPHDLWTSINTRDNCPCRRCKGLPAGNLTDVISDGGLRSAEYVTRSTCDEIATKVDKQEELHD